MHHDAINYKLAVDKNLKTNTYKSTISVQNNNINYIDNMQYMKRTKEDYCIAVDLDYVHCYYNKQTSQIFNFIKDQAIKIITSFPSLGMQWFRSKNLPNMTRFE